VKLDIGCGNKKAQGFTGMDSRNREGVDIVHDVERYPWPIESESVEAINASHVLEHLKPWEFINVMNECWRVMKPGGNMTIKTPYGLAYAYDPTHSILFQESSFQYLSPLSHVYNVYEPKPWDVVHCQRNEYEQELSTVLIKRESV
jgi:DNA modification methylase